MKRLMTKLFNLPERTKKKLGNILIFLGGGQFIIIMIFAYLSIAKPSLGSSRTTHGWPAGIVFALVCLSSLLVIVLDVVGFFLTRNNPEG